MRHKFTLTNEHISLLRAMYVGWQEVEAGAPQIEPKRPYGNSDVIRDIVRILGKEEESCPHCGEILCDDGAELYHTMHRETETALQIVLSTGKFEAGTYVCDKYERNWEKE